MRLRDHEPQPMRPAVDPNCMCGEPHPCPWHGAWASGNHHRRPGPEGPQLSLNLDEETGGGASP
jgi:hypothetical protein